MHTLKAKHCKSRLWVACGRCVCVALGFGLAPRLRTFIPPFAMGELALFSLQARVSTMAGSTLASPLSRHHICCEVRLLGSLLRPWALLG